MTKPLTKADLERFTGTRHWYRHRVMSWVLFTDGTLYLAEAGGKWLLDEIALAQFHDEKLAVQYFQHWKLTVRADRTALLFCEDGDYNRLFSKEIKSTDFPLDEIRLFCIDKVILLESEY